MKKIACTFILLFAFLPHLLAAQEYYLLITGCSRSGTTYITHLLNQSGVRINHERFGPDGICSWLMAVESDSTPYGPGRKYENFRHIIHQVRHPLNVIASVYTLQEDRAWNYILAHTPEIHWQDSQLVKAAKYWYYWNLKAESIADWTYRIEDIKHRKTRRMFRESLGIDIDEDALANIPNNINSYGPHAQDFTWQDLKELLEPQLYNNIVSLAKRYGYTVPNNL